MNLVQCSLAGPPGAAKEVTGDAHVELRRRSEAAKVEATLEEAAGGASAEKKAS